MCDRMTTEG